MKILKTVMFIGLFVALVTIVVLYFATKKEVHTHFHAGFIVYVNGQKQDYSDNQYMYLDVCSVIAKQDNNDMQIRDMVHLHDNVGDVAHIHEEGATWNMLFKNMDISFPPDIPIVGYRNGKKVANLLSLSIKPYDSVIFIVGSDKGIDTSHYVPKQHIVDIEGKANMCGQ
jgi:hypothetical protein